MSRSTENICIMKAIDEFENGHSNKRVEYLKALYSDEGCSLNGFRFLRQPWCYIVFKHTDISKEPQFKGEDLVKVIPRFTIIEKIPDVLDSQPWTYL